MLRGSSAINPPNVKKLLEETAANDFGNVHPFARRELKQKKTRRGDFKDVLTELLFLDLITYISVLVTIWNGMTQPQTGSLEETWRNTMFTTLPG